MFLESLISKANPLQQITPFTSRGVIIDTSVAWEIVQGLVSARISKKRYEELEKILRFLEFIKLYQRWDKFVITPHVLAEVCNLFRDQYSKWTNYGEITKEVMPMIEHMRDCTVSKKEIFEHIDYDKPIIEIGDISIWVMADGCVQRKDKIAILSVDNRLNKRYEDNPRVLVMNYRNIVLNAL
jgi:hypothetical protein